ncbi:MAG: hypothetical protein J5800_01010 [Spirochaetales bacterium]|nr:hypothetical protein [Spirochaetales bacterium]
MPNVQQKKFNKGGLIALAFMAAMVGVVFLNVSIWLKIAIDVALILLFLFIRRGFIFFYRAAVAYKKGDEDRVWKNFEKALKAGVDFERKVSIGSVYVQSGDAKRGVEILEAIMTNPKAGNFRKNASVICSMGYWRLGNKQEAIKLLSDLRESGYRDDNLAINLETYYLETGDLKAAKKAITEGRKNNTENNGLLDNRGWYYIQMGFWQKAQEVYDELIDDRNAKFPEAYLHGAQVSIHYEDIEQAIDRLGWSSSKQFSKTCMVTKEYIANLLLGLENPATRADFAKAMDENYIEVSCARPFSGLEKAVEFDRSASDVIAPKEKPKYTPKKDTPKTASSDNDSPNTDVDDDDREPNTDLDDEDAAIAAEYGDVDDYDDSDIPDTSLDDDDDREPNTDLDEKDK